MIEPQFFGPCGLPEDAPVLDLLAASATEGVDPDELLEIELRCLETGLDPALFERSAALCDRLFAEARGDVEPMPERLRRRALASGQAIVAAAGAPAPGSATPAPPPPLPYPALRRLGGRLIAAAAVVMMLAAGALATAAASRWIEPTPGQRARALAGTPQAQIASWVPTSDAGPLSDVQGDIVWDPATSTGFLRLRGLPTNDPTQTRYQLWVVDGDRTEHPRVDGGLFDHPGTPGEVVIPVCAAVPVTRPTVFALTIEGPAGAVISAGPLRLIAQ